MQKLSNLLGAIITQDIVIANGGDDTRLITGVTADSRTVTPGALFVAVRGTAVDGHRFIHAAVEAGASAVVCETIPPSADESVAWIRVADSSVALGLLASQWHGNPSRQLSLIGVTGTNGKTTVATLVYNAFMTAGVKAGLLSTVENRIGDEVLPSTHTTGDPMEINANLRAMVDAGCRVAAMEVSSHGADQNRIAGLHFAGGIFTNLTRDHLDYHKTVQNYIHAKKKFFDMLPRGAFALTNIDDANGKVMTQNTAATVNTYSLRTAADFHCRVIESHLDSTLMSINGNEMHTRFTGRFNAYNLTAVYGALTLMGMDTHRAAVVLSTLRPVNGRFETYTSADGVTVIIDFAHTPDAIANVLGAIHAVVPDTEVITVIGAGGNRDHGKRPMMGAEAARRSNVLIITADNPRDENPADIAADIAAGVPADSTCRVCTILDRAEAIATAITRAPAGAVVLIAGKGHEDYQVVENGRTIHFNDHEHVSRALSLRR